MIEGLIAGLREAAEMAYVAAGIHRRRGEIQAAEALEGIARAMMMRASEETTPVDHDNTVTVKSLQSRWQRFLRWWICP